MLASKSDFYTPKQEEWADKLLLNMFWMILSMYWAIIHIWDICYLQEKISVDTKEENFDLNLLMFL